MDSKLSVQHGHHSPNNGIAKPPVHHHHARRKGRQNGGGGGKGIKVVYISSPMKLTASAEEFRAVVQELTGRDSNVADHDLDGAYDDYSYSSFRRVSPTAAAAAAAAEAGPRALSPTTTVVVAATNAGPGRRAPEYDAAMAEPPPFQGMYEYDLQAAESLLYGQDYW